MGEDSKAASGGATDLERHFSAGYTVPEPASSGESESDVDHLGMIGINALKDKGYFTRIVLEPSVLKRRLLNPQNIRVLIIDDDANTASLIEMTLHSAGCKTRMASNRKEIAQALGERPLPHLVLLDVMMPDVSGFDVLNRIRNHAELEKLPVLMLTALADRKNVARGLTLGADGYITKPVLPSVLLKAIEAAIGG